jgi:DNA-binding response OmpR family regulator
MGSSPPANFVQLTMPESAAAKRKALLVEDEFLIAIAAAELLSNLGFEVVGPARGVDEALWLVDEQSDLVLAVLDVHLGEDLVWPVARQLIEQSVPFLFITGDPGIQLPPGLENCQILVKPFDQGTLEHAIAAILPESRQTG